MGNVQEQREAMAKRKEELRQELVDSVHNMKDKGYSNVAIAKRYGLPESSVRILLTKPRRLR